MGSDRGRQKQIEKKKKKRAEAQRKAQASAPKQLGLSGAVRVASTLPFGPAFMTPSWRDGDEAEPRLVTVVITRKMPDGTLLPAIMLVDRTCLGVKDAFVIEPRDRNALTIHIDAIAEAHGVKNLEETSVLEAQSLVLHAVRYARSIGFEPHRDYADAAEVVGTPTEPLIMTPLAEPSRPVYVSGPNDDEVAVQKVLAAYDAKVLAQAIDADVTETLEEAT